MDVGERLFRLFFDRAELLFARSRIDRELTGDKHESVVDSCLRVVPAGFGSIRGVDSFDFHNSFLSWKATLFGDSSNLLKMSSIVDHDNAKRFHAKEQRRTQSREVKSLC